MLISAGISALSLEDALCSFQEYSVEVRTKEDREALKTHFSRYDFSKLSKNQKILYKSLLRQINHIKFSRDS